MPCLNEAETLAACIEKAQRYLSESGVAGEIVIGDNGSSDGSQDIARRCGARVIDVPVRGSGAALDAACRAARGRFIIMGDSDDSYDFYRLDPFLDALRAGNDLVMGNRFLAPLQPGAMPWKNRYIGNPILTGIGRLFFSSNVGDFHCGLRGFSKAAYERMDLRTTGMEFASEMVIKAALLQMRVSEVPTVLSPDGRSRPPHLRPWRDGWRHLRFMLLFSPKWLFLYPGMAAMTVGILLGGLLVLGPIHVGSVTLDVDTLVYCAFATTIGFQAVLFSLLSRMYAIQNKLYPDTPRFTTFLRWFTLELGVVIGLVVTLAGFAVAVYSVLEWKQQDFGNLNLASISRQTIPSATAMSLGIETILFSFFQSSLSLGVRQTSISEIE